MDISIALGGGGTRGAAHIGVLRVLERSGFRIRAIAGTSIGSVIAAFYASGRTPDQIEDIFLNVDQSKLYGWPLSEGPGLLGLRGIHDFLKAHLGDVTFEDLKLPCAAVAVDLNSNREIILQEGHVVEAILGSIAVPGLFPPKELQGYRLIDGGTLDPVPVRAARWLAPGLPVVAVPLMPPLEVPARSIGIFSLSVPIPLAKQLARMNITQAFRVFADSVDIASRQMAELRLILDEPELIVRPEVSGINLLDKIDVREIARCGEIATETALPNLLRAMSLSAQIARQVRRVLRHL
jgi:NTE family protein